MFNEGLLENTDSVTCTPIVSKKNGALIFQRDGYQLYYCSEPLTVQKPMWSGLKIMKMLSLPVEDHDGYIYFQSENNILYKASVDLPDGINLENQMTISSPFGYQDGFVYYQSSENNNLMRVPLNGGSPKQIGSFQTDSSPFVSNENVYFQGIDNQLWKVSTTDNTKYLSLLLGTQVTTSCSPFVSNDWIYFIDGISKKLYKVKSDKTGLSFIGNQFPKSTPFVYEDQILFQGTDNQLTIITTYGSSPQTLPYKTICSPFVYKGYIYIIDEDQTVKKIEIEKPYAGIRLGTRKASKSPVLVEGEFCYYRSDDDELIKIGINPDTTKGLFYPNTESSLDHRISSTPFIINGFLIFQDKTNKLMRISDCGGLFKMPYTTLSSPFVDKGFLYFQEGLTSNLWKIDTRASTGFTGGPLLPNYCKINSSPYVKNGVAYFQDFFTTQLMRVNTTDGSPPRFITDVKTKYSPVVDNDEYVYFVDSDNKLWAIKPTDGYIYPLPNPNYQYTVKSIPFVEGSYIYYQGSDNQCTRIGTIYGYDPIQLGPKNTYSSPIESNGVVYYLTKDPKKENAFLTFMVPVSKKDFSFYTCHGETGSSVGLNIYQTMRSLLDECANFLTFHQKETIVIKIQIDDWGGYVNQKDSVFKSLNTQLEKYPHFKQEKNKPTLKDVRGLFYYLNALDIMSSFGPYLSWKNNIKAEIIQLCVPEKINPYEFVAEVSVQDNYNSDTYFESTSRKEKTKNFMAALKSKSNDNFLINFASGNYLFILGVYANAAILESIGSSSNTSSPPRKTSLGWSFWDYALFPQLSEKYGLITPVDLIIDSNFGYKEYPDILGRVYSSL